MAEIKVIGSIIAKPRVRPNVYRLKRPAVSERMVRAVASRFGASSDRKAGTLCLNADVLAYTEGPLELAAYRVSEGLAFRDRTRWQADDGEMDLAIDDRKAERRAKEFAGELGFPGLDEAKFLKAARLRVGEADVETGRARERTIEVAVALQRMVDGIPTDGPGGKVVVYLDQEARAAGLERIWREIDRVYKKACDLRSPEAAIEEMAGQWRRKRCILEVEEVRFGYFEQGWRDRQLYLQPAYVIFAQATAGGEIRRKTVYVTSALAEPVARITPLRGRQQPQEQRPDRPYLTVRPEIPILSQ